MPALNRYFHTTTTGPFENVADSVSMWKLQDCVLVQMAWNLKLWKWWHRQLHLSCVLLDEIKTKLSQKAKIQKENVCFSTQKPQEGKRLNEPEPLPKKVHLSIYKFKKKNELIMGDHLCQCINNIKYPF